MTIFDIEAHNTEKVLSAFHKNRVSEAHFAGTNGYGYNDIGRDVIDRVFADVFGVEDALVRYNFINGTHALSTALFAVLRPNDVLVSLGGMYDTLHSVVASSGGGSLSDFGVKYQKLPLNSTVDEMLAANPKAVFIQKSKGYEWRNSFSSAKINAIADEIHKKAPKTVVIVDNCYGEFVEEEEPNRADLIVGSLIKNLGGGIAQTGAYIAGNAGLIELCANRLTSVGVGKKAGASLGATNREILMGLFMAPHIVSQAVQTAIFAAEIFENAGYEVNPLPKEPRTDIIQAIKLNAPEKLIKFCQAVQKNAPIDAFVNIEPWAMPGYNEKVIMASGSFTSGSSIELSADGTMKPPYIAYLQGALSFAHGKLAAQNALNAL